MTESHRRAVIDMAPNADAKTFRLDDKADISDPIGLDATAYQRTAEMIRRRAGAKTQGAAVMRIAVGTDHRGYELLPKIVMELQSLGCQVLEQAMCTERTCDYRTWRFPSRRRSRTARPNAACCYAARASACASRRTRCKASAQRWSTTRSAPTCPAVTTTPTSSACPPTCWAARHREDLQHLGDHRVRRRPPRPPCREDQRHRTRRRPAECGFRNRQHLLLITGKRGSGRFLLTKPSYPSNAYAGIMPPMLDEPPRVRVEGLDWRGLFPFLLIFNSFRMAIHPPSCFLRCSWWS